MKYFPKTFALIEEVSSVSSQENLQIQIIKEQVKSILISASLERSESLRKFTPPLQKLASRYTKRIQILAHEILEAISMKTLIYREKELTQGTWGRGQRFITAHSLVLMSPLMSGENSQLFVEWDLFLEEYQSQVYGKLGNYLNEENELQMQLAQFPETANMYVPMDLDPWLSPLLPDVTGPSQK